MLQAVISDVYNSHMTQVAQIPAAGLNSEPTLTIKMLANHILGAAINYKNININNYDTIRH
ncbi:MAG TPA: hypothetical protein VFS22_03850 [Flavisolibacter sp.]|nr:hypothetical protein [Flavisolibacter sp.]